MNLKDRFDGIFIEGGEMCLGMGKGKSGDHRSIFGLSTVVDVCDLIRVIWDWPMGSEVRFEFWYGRSRSHFFKAGRF